MDKRASPLVRWSILSRPKELGGLGIHSPILRNKALISKWIWRLSKDHNSLWARIITSKYKIALPFGIQELKLPHQGGTWKDICKIVVGDEHVKATLEEEWRRRIGNGLKTRFWLDKWLGDDTLKERYPRLFSLAIHKECMVESMGYWDGWTWQWQLVWRRQLRQWETGLSKQLAS